MEIGCSTMLSINRMYRKAIVIHFRFGIVSLCEQMVEFNTIHRSLGHIRLKYDTLDEVTNGYKHATETSRAQIQFMIDACFN